jgi:hypothetical protein
MYQPVPTCTILHLPFSTSSMVDQFGRQFCHVAFVEIHVSFSPIVRQQQFLFVFVFVTACK